MFVLAVVRDAVRVSPAAFGKAPANALRDEIDARYGGRVLSDVGFVICCETAKTVSDGLVHALDGGATYQAEFRLLVFRPFVGEVLRCTVEFVDENGLRCTTGFFSQIRIPVKYLPSSATFDPARRLYLDAKQRKIQTGDSVLVRVASVKFTRLSKRKRGLQATTSGPEVGIRMRSSSVDLSARDPVPSAMEVVASCASSGLGPVGWWR